MVLDTKLLLNKVKELLAVFLVSLGAKVVETGLYIELHLESMVKIESLRTMASRNAGSKVPSQVKNSLYV